MARVCRIVVIVFTLAYLLALFGWMAGSFGWFGQERDPLSGIFLIPLGLPWNRMVDWLPEPLWPWAGALAPVINLIILGLLCRLAQRKRHGA